MENGKKRIAILICSGSGFGGKLNIRPKYQREFVYKDKQRDAVIETVKKQFPLNVMYWVKNADDTYEVLADKIY